MKQFDPVSSKNRLIGRLNENPAWKVVTTDSVVDAILTATGEEVGELSRYAEHLFKESKWDTAQNIGSVTAAAGQVGYKPERAISATGNIYISLDARTHTVGSNIAVDKFLDDSTLPLSNWRVAQNNITLPRGSTTITDAEGNEYTLVNSVDLSAGSPYVEAAVVDGAIRTITIPAPEARAIAQYSRLDPYVYIPVAIKNFEAANRVATASFFTVAAVSAGVTREYRVVESLQLTGSGERNVEVIPDLYNRDLIYLKFNAKAARGYILDLSPAANFQELRVTYLATRGTAGNTAALTRFTVTVAGTTRPLYGINSLQLAGGRDQESAAEIKQRAPQHYLKTYTTATRGAYERSIQSIDFGAGVFANKVRTVGRRATAELDAAILVSILSPLLEARIRAGVITEQSIVDRIDQFLSPLKAPTDFFEYQAPEMVPVSVGVDIARPAAVAEKTTGELQAGVRGYLESYIGASSEELDFDRRITPSFMTASIRNLEPELSRNDVSVSLTEMEAVAPVNWTQAKAQLPNALAECRTLRCPISFNKVFKGNRFKKGEAYALRIDLLFKRTADASADYHTTIFLEDNGNRSENAFYYKADPFGIWPSNVTPDEYPFGATPDAGVAELSTAYQYYLGVDKARVFNANDYAALTNVAGQAADPPLVPGFANPGTQRQFIAYFEVDPDSKDDEPYASGWLEFSIDDLYATLQRYAATDEILANLLATAPLNQAKCNLSDQYFFNVFVADILARYVEIYVSVRLQDTNQGITPSRFDEEATVVYADTAESDVATVTTVSLSELKKQRFLSVRIENL